MSRRLPWLLTWAVLALLAFAPEAPARSVGLIVALIRQELIRYGLIDSAGNPAASVSTTGDALSGDGTSGTPLAVASVLETLVDGGGTATAGAGTVLDLTATGALALGTTSADVRWKKGGTGYFVALLGDGSGTAGVAAALPVVTVTTTTTLTADQSGAVVTDDGTDNGNVSTPTLPSAVAGLHFYFWCSLVDANDGMVITAASDDTITDLAATGTAGTLTAGVSNSGVHLVALDSTRWVVISANGNWTTSAP